MHGNLLWYQNIPHLTKLHYKIFFILRLKTYNVKIYISKTMVEWCTIILYPKDSEIETINKIEFVNLINKFKLLLFKDNMG